MHEVDEGTRQTGAGTPESAPEGGGGTEADPLIGMVLGLVPDAALVVDEHGTIVALNDNAETLFGYGPGELVGQRMETLVPERFRHRHRRQRDAYLAEPKVRAMGAGLDLSGRRRDGSEFPVDISLAPIATAEARLVVAAIRDVSDRRATEAAHAQLAAIVRSSLDAILAVTVEGRITSWNPGAERTLGYTTADVVGSHVSRLIPTERSPAFEELLDAAQLGEPAPPIDTEWLTRTGAHLPVAVTVSPMLDNAGGLTGFSVLLRDITEAKRAEAELRRLLDVSERQARWQEASAQIRLATLDGAPLERVLALVTDQAVALLGGTGAVLVLAPGSVAARSGPSTAALDGAEVALPELPAPAEGAAPRRLARSDLAHPLDAAFEGDEVLVAPVAGAGGTAGALVVDLPGGESEQAATIAAGLAEHAAVARELVAARADRERLLLADERERIARDLHDHAVQALFATGLSLQSVLPLVGNERAAGRVLEAVDSLDATIKQIRTAIFTLSAPPSAGGGLRATVVRLADEAARGMDFHPAVTFDGGVDTGVPASVAGEIEAVVREALANIGRHARARSASVEVRVAGGRVTVTVTDDGVGLPADPGPGVGNGLRNLRTRAERLGGGFEAGTRSGGGTRLTWWAPLAGT